MTSLLKNGREVRLPGGSSREEHVIEAAVRPLKLTLTSPDLLSVSPRAAAVVSPDALPLRLGASLRRL